MEFIIIMTIGNTELQPIGEQILQEEHCSILKTRLCTDTFLIIKQILEMNREYNLFFLFIDYDEAYNRINQSKLWAILFGCAPTNLVKA
jgi:hypothetical protein